jgi:hypothetical protein
VQNVATKKTYVVPMVAGQGTVRKETLGLPSGVGEPFIGLYVDGVV